MPGAERRHRKKALKPAIKRELVSYLTTQFTMSIRQACRMLSLSRTVFRYQPDTRRDEPVIQRLTEAAERYPCYGFKKLFQVLRRQGHVWNHKRVHRIYCLLKLNFRRKGKQRLPVRNPAPLATGKCQGSCRPWLIYAACFSRSGLSVVLPCHSQFRVGPDQRSGFAVLAA